MTKQEKETYPPKLKEIEEMLLKMRTDMLLNPPKSPKKKPPKR